MSSSLLRNLDKKHTSADVCSVDVIMARLRGTDCSRGFILDNFPRNAAQAQLLDQQLQSTFNQGVSCVLDLEVSVKALETRAKKRFVDAKTGLPVKEAGLPSWMSVTVWHDESTLDPAEATEHTPAAEYSADESHVRRGDDAPELFQQRLQRYANNIQDLRTHYGNECCVALSGELESQHVLADAKREVHRRRLKTHLTVDTLSGKQVSLDVSNISSVGELKELIQIGEGMPVQEQKLLDNTRELADSESIPPSNITLLRQRKKHVRQGVTAPELEHLVSSLYDDSDAIATVRSEISPFIDAVKSSSSWVETWDRQECGCCTETKRYVGQDPPKAQMCSQLVEDVSRRVKACRNELARVESTRFEHHIDQASQKLDRAIQRMDVWNAFWFRLCLPCCMDPFPEQFDLAEVEALCADVLEKAEGTRKDLTSFTMQAATKTNKTLCCVHVPAHAEPLSP